MKFLDIARIHIRSGKGGNGGNVGFVNMLTVIRKKGSLSAFF